MKIIDIDHWKRKEHYLFFSKMKSPYCGIVTELDCSETYHLAKEIKTSFFAQYLHRSMVAVNSVDEFHYRIIGDDVVEFDTIHAGSTIGREDGTFGFSYMEYSPDFDVFNKRLQLEIQAVHNSKGLRLNNDDIQHNLIRHSTFPWGNFTGLLQPTDFNPKDSVPKIIFGKYSEKNGRKMMPVSVEVHHGLMDGLHIAKYLEAFQSQLNLE